METKIDFVQLREWLINATTTRPVGIYIEGGGNTLINNKSDSGIVAVGDDNSLHGNESNYFIIKGNSNKLVDNKVIETLNDLTKDEKLQLLDLLKEPQKNEADIRVWLRKIFNGLTIKGGVKLFNIPGVSDINFSLEKKF